MYFRIIFIWVENNNKQTSDLFTLNNSSWENYIISDEVQKDKIQKNQLINAKYLNFGPIPFGPSKKINIDLKIDNSSILLDDLLKIRQSEFEFNFIHSSISMLDDILAYEIDEKKDLDELSLGKSIFIKNKQLIKLPLNSDKKELVFLSHKGNIVSFGKLTGDLFQPHKVLT